MNKKMLKTIKIALVCFAIFILIGTLIVSRDEHHLETCHEECCIYCSLIIFTQNIVKITIAVVVAMVIGFLIYFFLSRLHKEKAVYVQSSLVFQKVQLNE